MRRTLFAATALTIGASLPAFAQSWAPEPPNGYMTAPPSTWDQQEFWRHRSEAQREAFWHEYRHESWRCDHGDREACHWLHDHERG